MDNVRRVLEELENPVELGSDPQTALTLPGLLHLDRASPFHALPARAWDALLGLLAFAIWRVRYGVLGATYQADAAVHGAMALDPWHLNAIYFWGQSRLGSLTPMLAWPLVTAGVHAGVAVQLIVLAQSAIGLTLCLAFIERWPWKVAFCALCAFPSFRLAEQLCQAGEPGCSLFFLMGLQLTVLQSAKSKVQPWRAGAAATLSVLMLWVGESGIILLASEGFVCAWLALSRRTLENWRVWAAGALGAAVPLPLIVAGKLHSVAEPRAWMKVPAAEAWASLLDLGPQFHALIPLLNGRLALPAVMGLAVATAWWTGRELASGSLPSVASFIGFAPLLGFVSTASSLWFALNDRHPRYLTFPAVICLFAVCLWGARLASRWPAPAAFLSFVLVAGAIVIDGHLDPKATGIGEAWLLKVDAARAQGCQSVIADYWEAYPYYTLSEGALPATPRETSFVRNAGLAVKAVTSSDVCVIPWWLEPGTCPAELTQFSHTLKLQRTSQLPVNAGSFTLCHFRADPSAR